jgi:putative peptide zinc metalloprotease protein
MGAALGPPLSGPRGTVQEVKRHREEEHTQARSDGRPPQLAEGIELIGEYEDSGYKEPPALARRADGQIIQLPALLYLVAASIDGRRSYEEIADRVTKACGRELAPEDVEFLVDEKLWPLGFIEGPGGETPEVQKADPLLALKLRVAIVPERVVAAITSVFYPFFFPPVILAVILALVSFDIWMFFLHGIAQSARSIVYNPLLLFMVLGLVIVATALHEIGHATAARYGGAKPGVMGAGIYVVWPAFYTDVTDAYRLNRRGRLRTDLGGIYFNGLFAVGTAGVYLLTRFEPLLVIVLVQHFQISQQLLPFLRLDGYYILSDLTGVPDLFARIKPTLRSLIPGRKDARASALKPWVRATVTAWVFVLVPVLLFTFGSILINGPRIVATAYDSLLFHYDKTRAAFGAGETAAGALAALQMATLSLPALGMAVSSTRAGKRAFMGGWHWSEGAPMRRFALVSGTAVLFAALGYVWYPNGDYKTIQRGERGTVQGAIRQFAMLPTGRPGLTREREQQLSGVTDQAGQGTTGQTQPTSTSTTGSQTGTATSTGTTTGTTRSTSTGTTTGTTRSTSTGTTRSTSTGTTTGTSTSGSTTTSGTTTTP